MYESVELVKPNNAMYKYDYIWLDCNGEIRNKTMIRTDHKTGDYNSSIQNIPWWTYDGSSTGQATGSRSDVRLKPVALFNHPFVTKGYIVVCETYQYNYDTDTLSPHPTNTRHENFVLMEKAETFKPQFGIEQEYVLYHRNGVPYGWTSDSDPGLGEQGPYYCSVGGDRTFGRNISIEHMQACLDAGIKICGTNGEVMPGQWEYQIGICDGNEIGDHMLVSRYLLHRITEKYDIFVSFHPKPKSGDWNGSGCHTNFSTELMRHEDGLKHIIQARDKLMLKHSEHMEVYGTDNRARMLGAYETANYDEFDKGAHDGIGDRKASVRIPLHVYLDKCGYLEDRRVASNADIYSVTTKIIKTTCLDE